MSGRPQRVRSIINYGENSRGSINSSDDSDEDFMPNNNLKDKTRPQKEKKRRITYHETEVEIGHYKLPVHALRVNSSPNSLLTPNVFKTNAVDSKSFSGESIVEESDFSSGSDLTDFDELQKIDKSSQKISKEAALQVDSISENYEIHSEESDSVVKVLDSASSNEEKLSDTKHSGVHDTNNLTHSSPNIREKNFSPRVFTQAHKHLMHLTKNGSSQPNSSNSGLIIVSAETKSLLDLSSSQLEPKLENESPFLKKPKLSLSTRPFNESSNAHILEGKPQPGTSPNGHLRMMHSKLRLPCTGLSYSSKLPSLHPKKTNN